MPEQARVDVHVQLVPVPHFGTDVLHSDPRVIRDILCHRVGKDAEHLADRIDQLRLQVTRGGVRANHVPRGVPWE